MKGELENDAVRRLLTSHTIGRIGCVHRRQPYIFPVNYAFDGTNIICQSDEGVKLNILRKHKRSCFQVDAVVNLGFWQSILALGVFEELSGREAENARQLLYNRLFPKNTHMTEAESLLRAEALIKNGKRIKKVMFRINIEKITGRYEHPVAHTADSAEEALL